MKALKIIAVTVAVLISLIALAFFILKAIGNCRVSEYLEEDVDFKEFSYRKGQVRFGYEAEEGKFINVRYFYFFPSDTIKMRIPATGLMIEVDED